MRIFNDFIAQTSATVGLGYTFYTAPTNGLLVQGRLGVGKTDPVSTIDVDTSAGNDLFVVNNAGFVGINTSSTTGVGPEALIIYQPAGSSSFTLVNAVANVNNYAQLVISNRSSGILASADVVAQADLGTETKNFINMGINNSLYSQQGQFGAPLDAYFYATGQELYIGNLTTNKSLHLFTSGTQSGTAFTSAVKMTITPGGNIGVGTVDTNSWLSIRPGTISTACIELYAGPLMTTAMAGSIEYDGKAIFSTPQAANQRGVVPSMSFVMLTADYTLTNTGAPQKLFNATPNGALTVAPDTTYVFEGQFFIRAMSGTSGNARFSIQGGGTASISTAAILVTGADTSNPALGSAAGASFSSSFTTTGLNMVTAATGVAMYASVRGIFRVTVGGTIIPSIILTTGVAAVAIANSWFMCYPVGTATTTVIGAWS